ncbi:MAG: hypothetical protein IJ417_00225 [Bacteroidaceae bacterium]|nr:hypothetical protein [Bacteroidaceae bacterium]
MFVIQLFVSAAKIQQRNEKRYKTGKESSSKGIFQSAACSRKSAARRSIFCRAADELLLHGGQTSVGQQILIRKATDFSVQRDD